MNGGDYSPQRGMSLLAAVAAVAWRWGSITLYRLLLLLRLWRLQLLGVHVAVGGGSRSRMAMEASERWRTMMRIMSLRVLLLRRRLLRRRLLLQRLLLLQCETTR